MSGTSNKNLSPLDRKLLRHARCTHRLFRPNREAAAAILALQSLVEGLPQGEANVSAHLASNSCWLAAQLAVIEELAVKAHGRITKMVGFYPDLFPRYLRETRAEIRAGRRAA